MHDSLNSRKNSCANAQFSPDPMKMPHVLLLFSHRYNPSLHRGVARHAGKACWHLSMLIHPDGRRLAGLSGLSGVLLADRFDTAVIESIATSGLPVVNLSANPESFSGARVTGDNRAIGEAAAAYFLERRYRNFAYYGEATSVASVVRYESFAATLMRHGRGCLLIDSRNDGSAAVMDWESEMRSIRRQLDLLAVPAAVFCYNDFHAARLLDAVLQDGRQVPEEFSILGVDDDPLICENLAVPLSSVRHPLEEVGHRAAELLEEIMAGRAARSTQLLLPPMGVTSRRSTECFAVAHPTLQKILLHMDRHYRSPLGLEEIAAAAGVSPRTVQSLLHDELGTTVTEELIKRRIARARRLLANPAPAVADVAALSGFASSSYFHHVFKRETGSTPREFRRQCAERGMIG